MSLPKEEPVASADAGAAASPPALPFGLALAALVLSVAALAWPPLRPVAAWLLPVNLGALVWQLWRSRTRHDRARPDGEWARRAGRLEALLDDAWLLRTDRQGRLRHVRPPAEPGAHAPLPAPGTPMDAAWRCEDGADDLAWQRAWHEGTPLPRTRVRPAASADAGVWALRAEPVLDAQGHLQGHEISLRPMPHAPAPGVATLESEPFIYSVSHDLRAPLRVVLGFARMVQEDHAAALGSDGREHLARIEHAAERMSSMIDALLSLSRLSSRPLAHEAVDLSSMAQGVMDELQRLTPERRVSLQIDPNLHALGDATLLRLVLENLLGNAWKYSAKRDLAVISFGAVRTPDGLLRYHVRDNGAGFDMRYADRLFAPFQRLHSATEFEGTGVGLASARRIIERHGGKLWGEGQVDQGASFYFTLP